ncbi:hypothetical protein BMS3Abin03_03056 [bacterium BMS3Abin03]|nr:hypothetical protein BMS3Abin03_03056 [bacterium BMS3Abin03]
MGIGSFINAQSITDNFKLAYPDFVLQGNTFEVSIITSNEFEKADKLDLYIIPHIGIKTKQVLLRTGNNEKQIPFSDASSEGYMYDAVMCEINFNDQGSLAAGSFFQILIRFQGEFVDYSEIEFYGEFKKNNRVINYLQNSDVDIAGDYLNHYRAKINFYEVTRVAGNALLMKENSEFGIVPRLDIKNNLLIDFWAKFKDKVNNFLNISNNQTGLVEYSLTTNDFQILTAESDFQNQRNLTPYFVSQNVWQHYSILFSPEDNAASFYCNGKIFSRFDFPPTISIDNLSFTFTNHNNGTIELDQLRFIDLNESVETGWQSSHFHSFISDSSNLKLQLSFNESSISKLENNELLSLKNIELIRSDAPIFPRAPELNVKVLNNFYELEWSGGDFKNAAEYFVERSDGGSQFAVISKIDADNTTAKNYSFLSERRDNTEVVYFRIGQKNKDGSKVYSSQVKIGQGEMDEFIVGQNFPNPFNPSTQITVEVLEDTDLEIVVYNLEGKTVSVLHNGFLSKGVHQFTFDGSELPSGIYLYKVSSPHFNQTKKMILAK